MFEDNSVDCVASKLVEFILTIAKEFIPLREYSFMKSTHPWLNQKCIDFVASKHAAENTDKYKELQEICSKALMNEYTEHVGRMKAKVSSLPKSSKKWWKLSSNFMLKSAIHENIPPSQQSDGSWALSPFEKAELFATSFQNKFGILQSAGEDEHMKDAPLEPSFMIIRSRWIKRILRLLDGNSASGPDGMPSYF